MRVVRLLTFLQYVLLHLHFSKVHSSVFSKSGFTSCYVSNYTCTLSSQQERSRRYRNILTCTTSQVHACFPQFGHPSVRLVDSAIARDSDSDTAPHAFDYRHVDTLNIFADLTQIPGAALRFLTSLEVLNIDRPPTHVSDRSLITLDIHNNAFEEADGLREVTFRHVDFTHIPPYRHRRSPWSRQLGHALSKAAALNRLTFDQCRFDRLNRKFFGDQYVTELSLTSCRVVSGGGFTNDALDGYGQSLEQLIIKDTALPSFPSTIRNLKSLTKLVLSGCDLTSVPDDAFSESSSPVDSSTVDSVSSSSRTLQELDLSFNRLEDIGSHAFRPLIDLSQLNLEGNPALVSLPHHVFIHNRRLKSIDLRDCTRLHSLTMDHLRGLENTLTRLSLRNCRSLRALQVNNLTRLKELNAQSCGLEKLTKGMFGRQQRFTDGELSVSDNPLTSIEEGTFDGVDLPRIWQLRSTHLTALDLSSVLTGAGSLMSLELKRNLVLNNLTVSDLKKVPPTLREIKLGANGDFRLSDVGGSLKRFLLDRKAKLIIGEGSLCSCDWYWMREMRPFIEFQTGESTHRRWSLRDSASAFDNEDGAYCCNGIARPDTNDTLPLYAHSFLAKFDEYCGKGDAPHKNRLLSSCNGGSSLSLRVQNSRDFLISVTAVVAMMVARTVFL